MEMLLSHLLASLRAYELRFIAAFLRLRKRHDNRSAWLPLLQHFWLATDRHLAYLETLSPAARSALWRLVETKRLPAAPFFANFGRLQQTGRYSKDTFFGLVPRQRESSVRRQAASRLAVTSASQELFQIGLLYSEEGRPVDQAHWLVIPNDLRPLLHDWLCQTTQPQQPKLEPTQPADRSLSTPLPLLHDLTQLLALACQSPSGLRIAPRFPLNEQWHILAPRLWSAASPTPITRDEGNEWLRFLLFVATASGLLRNGLPQPFLWEWAALPADQQIRHLWQSWLAAGPTLRHRLRQPSLEGMPGWESIFPGDTKTLFSAADLTHRLLNQANEPLWPHNPWFHKLSEIDQRFDTLLCHSLIRWGIVESVENHPFPFPVSLDPEDDVQFIDRKREGATQRNVTLYRLTGLGCFLLQSAEPRPFPWSWQSATQQWSAVTSIQTTTSPLLLVRRADGDLWTLLQLAPFCDEIKLEMATGAVDGDHSKTEQREQSQRVQILRFTPLSMARATANGHTSAELWAAVQHSAMPITPSDWQHLQTWLENGKPVKLQTLFLLRSNNTEQMRQIQQTATLRKHLGEQLTPTVTAWHGDRDDFIGRLQQAGFFPQAHWPEAEQDTKSEDGQPQPTSPYTETSVCLPCEDAAALWLAVQVLDHVRRYASVPLRPSPDAVKLLFNSLSEQQQATLEAHVRKITSALEDAVDQLPHAPPKHPSDPDQWRPLLTQAMDLRCDVEMVHQSAGRNLPTRRRVTPFYIDEQRFGGPTLRGWCHGSGRDLWFRLDRIQELKVLSQ